MHDLSKVFGFIAAFGWAVSCGLCIWATQVKLPIASGDVVSAAPIQSYVKRTGIINSWAAALGSASAALSALSLFFS